MIKYVVDVVDPRNPETGTGGYAHRFEFDSEADARLAYLRAIGAGFESKVERVLDHKALASRAMSARNAQGTSRTASGRGARRAPSAS